MPIPIDFWPLAAMIGTGTVLTVRAGISAIRRDRSRARRRLPETQPRVTATNEEGREAYLQQEPYTASFGSSLLDIELEALGVLRQVDGLAARHRVRLQIAVQPGLAVRADARGFRLALIGVLENAIGQTPCGKVLLGASRHGGRIQIAVLDDGKGPERLVQEASLRPVERIVALHGGTLQVETRPGQGTLVIMRLPEPVTAAAARSAGAPDARASPDVARAAAEPSASWGETEPIEG